MAKELNIIKSKGNILPFEAAEDSSSRFHMVLLELKKISKTDLNDFLKKVLDAVANTLNVERVSIWFYSEDRSSIYCDYLYIKKTGENSTESTLCIKDFPEYFKAIESELYVAANDAQNDPRTKELADIYLKPKNVYSLMDIPIHFRGKTVGIICHEEEGRIREWKREELDFAAAISVLVSTSLEIDFRKKKELDLEESQRFLATLISNLPGYVYRVIKEGENWSIQYISEGVFDLTGYRPEELLHNRVLYYSMMVNEEDKKEVTEIITKALSEKKPYQINYRISTRSGWLKWVWEQGRGVYSPDGQLIATEGFITDITDKKLFEEEIIKKNKEFAALYQIGKSLSKLAEPGKIIEDISTMLGKLFNTENLYVALYDENRNYISFPYYSIEGIKQKREGRTPGNGLTEYIIKTKKPLLINSAKREFYKKIGVDTEGKDALSVLSVPMIVGEKVLGVITLQDYRVENAFTETQLELLATVASQAAIALENADLYLEVTKSLREKDILLQEVHHRVKNNLQIMSSLIKLQSHYINDTKMLDIMKETEGRIQSMAIVHSKLYNTKDYEQINFAEYVKNLTDNFWNSYGFRLKNISFRIDIIDILLNIDTALPCGLIINELVSNAIKYAFPENRNGEILISLKSGDDKKYILTIKDNGVGVPENVKLSESDTLGIQLVTLLTKQMHGDLQINTGEEKGVEFIINLEEAVYKSRK